MIFIEVAHYYNNCSDYLQNAPRENVMVY